MTVSVADPPVSTALTLLQTAKDELVVSGSSYDAMLGRLIDEASETVTHWAGRSLYRAQFTETRMGNGNRRIILSRSPVVSLSSVTFQGDAITDAAVEVAETGTLYRTGGFGTVYAVGEWSFTYTAGWLLPGDTISGSISVAASDDSYNSATAAFHKYLVAGDMILAQGFSNAANNGYKRVVSATTSKIIVSASLVDEGSATRTIVIRNLPGWMERAALDLVKMAFSGRDRDPNVGSIRIGDASISYLSSVAGGRDAIDKIRSRVSALARSS